jgi:hypothetical protein
MEKKCNIKLTSAHNSYEWKRSVILNIHQLIIHMNGKEVYYNKFTLFWLLWYHMKVIPETSRAYCFNIDVFICFATQVFINTSMLKFWDGHIEIIEQKLFRNKDRSLDIKIAIWCCYGNSKPSYNSNEWKRSVILNIHQLIIHMNGKEV